ncbi:MAG: outer membrane protein assembly factor BamD [Gemmatimonadales bacterium]
MTAGRSLRWLVVAALAAGCWPFGGGKSQPAAPVALANSPRTIDSLWQAGQQAFNHGDWGEANKIFTRLSTSMPVTDQRLARVGFFRGEIELALGNELDAVRYFRRLADENPDDSLAPNALLRAADAYSYLWRRPELDPTYGTTAMGVYQEVISRYPGTDAAKRADQAVRGLQERFARKEYQSALFYYRYKATESAILLLRELIVQYPRSEVVPEALEKLVQAYQSLGYKEDVKETCDYIAQFHPDPKGPARFCPAAAPADSIGSR